MSTTKWAIHSSKLEESETGYSAEFTATNMGTGKQVTITVQQKKGEPVGDLIGGLSALAQLLHKVSLEPDEPPTNAGSLH